MSFIEYFRSLDKVGVCKPKLKGPRVTFVPVGTDFGTRRTVGRLPEEDQGSCRTKISPLLYITLCG